ncbi:leucine efflux protein LeuE [Plantactinospora soyae]|uniref:Leucine efflux protein n=1 Tax=Plantactinospora soyae TaxID=1544732 RepID=A0A927M4Q4_9ACTN|nr:leucine efflux protein LeuE [Plantactinospora soyae]MBE1487987.1 leucine efflux protein [Plantactinospora soyae]
MLGITDIWTYLLGTVAIILLPGPNSLFVLATAAKTGVRTGYRAAAGVFVGDAVLMALSAAGVASLLTTHPPIFMVIKYAGAAYLGYLGLGMLRGAWRRWRTRNEPAAPDPAGARPATVAPAAAVDRPFRRAAAISLLNPKAILFFISFFIQFVDPAYPHPALSFLMLGLIVQVTSALYLTMLIFAGSHLAAQFRRRRRLTAAVTTGIGALFLGFGLKLATATVG